MQRYDTYKDSGVKWLGEIPSHWEVRKNKYLFRESDERNVGRKYQLLSFSKSKGIIPYNETNDKEYSAEDISSYKVLHVGQLLENRLQAWNGMFASSKIEGCVSPDYSVFNPIGNQVNVDYYAYLFRTDLYIEQWANASKGVGAGFNRLYTPQFGSIYSLFPPRNEQDAIVSYLDEKMAKIDAAIAQQQKMIDLLNERKQIIINRAVTKGLNPNAKMKDSGVEWIGEVPEHWEVRRLKTLFNYISRGITPNYVEQSNSRVVNQATFSKGYFDRYNQRFTVAMEYNDSFVRNGDILMASTGGGVLGKVYYFEGQEDNNVADSHVTIIRTDNKEVNGKFYCYLFSTQYDMINAVMAKGSTNQTELQRQELTSLFVPVPTRKEQDEIVKHLDTLSEQIETIIVQYRNQISLLQERKQIVINEVVTGKVRVTN